jgi:ppGpp synthetase/RelA/SpoT-type nucleotidyltranferase
MKSNFLMSARTNAAGISLDSQRLFSDAPEDFEFESSDMALTVPKFSNAKVDKAGAALASGSASDIDYQIIDNWRDAHDYPLNIFQAGLRKRAKDTDGKILVAQRKKRLFSIGEKLKHSTMRLSAMQDIGGCRAVMYDIQEVNNLVESYENSDIKHKLFEKNDYIDQPKPSGYRGIHLVYKYAGNKTEYHNLKIEIQIRTLNQHAWATAVETVDVFTSQALKSNRGTKEWKRFFQLMGTAIAYKESGNPVPNMPGYDGDLKELLIHYVSELDVFASLRDFETALKQLPNFRYSPTDRYYLLVLDPHSKELEVWGYRENEHQIANEAYSNMEYEIRRTGKNAVLVSVDSVAELKKAYPNYFLDTALFLELVDWAIK